MHDTTKAIGVETIYIRLNDFWNGRCPYCDAEVEELYPDAGHLFRNIDKWINMVTYWFKCTNSACTGPGTFKAPQPYVLPYKKFGQDVWLFVCLEWERFKTTPKEISQRLYYLGVLISDDVVAEILDTYKLLKEGSVDQETMDVVNTQGGIIIGCDGTPTETGKPSLWTFYDVISGRMLHVEFLKHADHETLLRIFRSIQEKYGVPVKGFLSDHQPSIVNACMEFDPSLPHQFCHYHFLRNHWAFIEEKDRHLNKELQILVHKLPIMIKDTNGGTIYSPGIKVDKQDFFAPLAKLLEKSVNFKDEEFTQLKGILAFEALEKITTSITGELQMLDQSLRPVNQLVVTRDIIQQELDTLRQLYTDVQELVSMFQIIRNKLGDPNLSKEEKIKQLEKEYAALWKKYKVKAGYRAREDVKTLQPKYSLSNEIISCQWCRLWKTQETGLFHYMDVDGMEKTNIANEHIFEELRREVVKAHGESHEAYMILTRGGFLAKDISSKDTFTVQEVLTRYDVKGMKVIREPLQERIDEQTSWFKNAPLVTDAVHIIVQKIQNKAWESE
jgi:hypothetical protein